MERPLIILTTEDVVLLVTVLVVVVLALMLRRRRGPPGTGVMPVVGDAAHDGPTDVLTPAYDQLRALEAIEIRTLRAIADHRARMQAMRQHLAHGTAAEQAVLDTLERLTFMAITAQHDRALREALTSEGVEE
jgi:hypothetical protein